MKLNENRLVYRKSAIFHQMSGLRPHSPEMLLGVMEFHRFWVAFLVKNVEISEIEHFLVNFTDFHESSKNSRVFH